MVTAILTLAVVWCLFYGRISPAALIPLCAGLGAALFLLGRHKHSRFLAIDIFAQISRLNRVNSALKFWTGLALMVVCISSRSPVTGVFLSAAMLVLTVCAGGVRLHDYIQMLALPVSFLMLGGLALLFEINAPGHGVLSFNLFGLWLSISAEAQIRTALVIARALGAVSCLYAVSLSTPMSEIISVLRRAKCPNVLTTLMYLIYRYIFILLNLYHTMKDAAKSRLGHIDYRTSVRTTGNLYANLLACSYHRAAGNFDAMESRCFDTEIRFLESEKKLTAAHTAAAVGFCAAALAVFFLFW